jgi:transcriptional regulator with XRE-family HTH domain
MVPARREPTSAARLRPARRYPLGHLDTWAADSIGPLIAGLRLAAGKSQLRLAALLCAASGLPTVTRHEVSRWEREERIPSRFWLGWLALVLEYPLDLLERAAAVARARRALPPVAPTASIFSPASPTRHVGARAGAHGGPASPTPAGWPHEAGAPVLRRLDDLVGGVDLAPLVTPAARAMLRQAREATGPERARLLLQAADLAQLEGWVWADAGVRDRAVRAHRRALRIAETLDDPPLVGLVLTTAAHLGLVPGGPAGALRAAQAGYLRCRVRVPSQVRALLLHRVAFAAARAGERRRSEAALARAEREYARRPAGGDPGWAYWLNDVELSAMTGRCIAALGRPRASEPLLRDSLATGRLTGRTRAVYQAWLAGVHLDSGEVEQACVQARAALLSTIQAGTVRGLRHVDAVHRRLARFGGVDAVREFAVLVAAARPYLPATAPPNRPAARHHPLAARRRPAPPPADPSAAGNGRQPAPGTDSVET